MSKRGGKRTKGVSNAKPKACKVCGKVFQCKAWLYPPGPHEKKYCSNECKWAFSRVDPAESFWGKVNKTEGCWLWTGFVNHDGYGRMGGRRGQWSGYRAHRFSWELHNGRKVPAGMSVMHICDTPACVRPDHLRLGSHAENMEDMERKGRSGTLGEKNHNAKLTAEKVAAIKRDWRKDGAWKGAKSNAAELAARYGVNKSAIQNIIYGRTWKQVR